MSQVDGGDVRIEVGGALAGSGAPSTRKLANALWGVGFFTLLMAVATALDKPAHGVPFQHHVAAYYLTLAAIFLAGVVEICTAVWVHDATPDNAPRRRVLGKGVLLVSTVPLAVVVTIGGYTVLIKGA